MKKLHKLWCLTALAATATYFLGGFHDRTVSANNTPQTLPLSQNWSTTTLITANDDWSGVPGVVGFLGNYDAASPTGVDPRTLLAPFATNDVDVIANQSAVTLTNGGVAEFDGIANPVVALNGSGTADAPSVVFYLNTTGFGSVLFNCNVRDIDDTADSSIQQVDVQYRVGGAGSYASVPGGYIADASSGPSTTMTTPLSLILPAAAANQANVEIRVITTNAAGNDEWLGIDDVMITGTPIEPSNAPNDLNGDGKTDYIVIRNVGGQGRWFFNYNGVATPTQAVDWGIPGDRVMLEDFDGDSKDDITVWRANDTGGSTFYILNSATGTARVEQFGQPGDNAGVIGDYDGDGKADVAVYRAVSGPAPQQNIWFYRASSNNPSGNVTYVPWGTSGDSAAPGDYDGDGKFDFVVQRSTASGTANFWTLFANGATAPVIYFGENDDRFVPGDYDGDGKHDIATVKSVAGAWQWRYLSSLNGSIIYQNFGIAPFDSLAQGDYDGDGKVEPGIFRSSSDPDNNNFWSLNSSDGGIRVFELGQQMDTPVNSWNNH